MSVDWFCCCSTMGSRYSLGPVRFHGTTKVTIRVELLDTIG